MAPEIVKPETDSAQISFPPPFVYLGFLLLGLVADRFSPYWAGIGIEYPLRLILGGVIGAAGIFIMLSGTRRFRKLGTNVEPWKPTNQIVSSGIYRVTRNPMYLGMALLYLGLALALNSIGALIFLPVVLLVIRTQVIAREERYLEAKFGEEYLTYKNSVRRWI